MLVVYSRFVCLGYFLNNYIALLILFQADHVSLIPKHLTLLSLNSLLIEYIHSIRVDDPQNTKIAHFKRLLLTSEENKEVHVCTLTMPYLCIPATVLKITFP